MNTIQQWLKLSDRTKQNIFEETAKAVGLPNAAALEKDWWVVRTLELVFKSSKVCCSIHHFLFII